MIRQTALYSVPALIANFFLVSAHREENVDSPDRLRALLGCLQAVAAEWGLPVLVSTHPRTRKRLGSLGDSGLSDLVRFHEPFGFLDYNRLQMSAACVPVGLRHDRRGVPNLGVPGGNAALVHRAA